MRVRISNVLRRRQAQRPLRSYIARTLLPRVIGFAALAAALLVGNVMAVDPLAAPADTAPQPVPAWSAADTRTHPGCVPAAQWPAGTLADAVVVRDFAVDRDQQLSFNVAWERNHNGTESDDVWVIGVCP